jgi:hypothetical protein
MRGLTLSDGLDLVLLATAPPLSMNHRKRQNWLIGQRGPEPFDSPNVQEVTAKSAGEPREACRVVLPVSLPPLER